MSHWESERHAIRHLLDERHPAHAMAAYYALNHPGDRTTLIPWPSPPTRATAYLCLSMTGLDLFRPLLTSHLPITSEATAALFHDVLPPGAALLISAPVQERPILAALFDVEQEAILRLFDYRQLRTEPELNVLMSQETTPQGWPRFIIQQPDQQTGQNKAIASAQVNWQGRYYAEISVQTAPGYQRRGFARSVVQALVADIQASGRTPLYRVETGNEASLALAEAVGFRPTGFESVMLEATLREKPAGLR